MRHGFFPGVMAMIMMAAQLGTMYFLSQEKPLRCCRYGCESICGRTMTETGNACKDAAQVATESGETHHAACGSASQEPAFDTSEWDGFPPIPVQAMPTPPFREFPFFSLLNPYCGSLLEPLDPPPRLS